MKRDRKTDGDNHDLEGALVESLDSDALVDLGRALPRDMPVGRVTGG